ncbi:MAG: hypothetical protein LBV17_07780 [Treponema sp.]|jgi:hypothetical protein|nr:hypothetical protein [Treponema sp.]
MKNTMEIHIPIINKHHCCNDCKKKKGKICLAYNKPTSEVALDCKPKPEWEIAEEI